MAPAALTAELLSTAPGIAARLAALLAGLVALIARAFLKHPRHAATILPLCTWLQRTAHRFARIMQQLETGTLRQRTPRPGHPTSGKRPIAIPHQRAWLLAALRHEGAYFASHIEALLTEPDTAALIAATPQAQRLLRPICNMLSIMPAPIRLAPPTRVSRKPDGTPARHGARPARGDLATWRSSPRAGAQPAHRQAAPEPPPDPYADLCPRLHTRWPFNQLSQFRPA